MNARCHSKAPVSAVVHWRNCCLTSCDLTLDHERRSEGAWSCRFESPQLHPLLCAVLSICFWVTGTRNKHSTCANYVLIITMTVGESTKGRLWNLNKSSRPQETLSCGKHDSPSHTKKPKLAQRPGTGPSLFEIKWALSWIRRPNTDARLNKKATTGQKGSSDTKRIPICNIEVRGLFCVKSAI